MNLPNCYRCGHSPDWHRLDSELNAGPNDPAAMFRCIGYDCTVDYSKPPDSPCDCPDFVPRTPQQEDNDGVQERSASPAAPVVDESPPVES